MHPDTASPRVGCGGTVLSLLAEPLNVPILRAHLDAPLRLPDLQERVGAVAPRALRTRVVNLRKVHALERRVLKGMPYTVENELADLGRELLAVAETVEAWLARAPQAPIPLGGEPAKGVIRALVGGWGSTMLEALAADPMPLTELSGIIPDLSYPALERRLSAMRAAQLVERSIGRGAARPHSVTDWARQAVAPIAAAGRCECCHLLPSPSRRAGSPSRPPCSSPCRWSSCRSHTAAFARSGSARDPPSRARPSRSSASM